MSEENDVEWCVTRYCGFEKTNLTTCGLLGVQGWLRRGRIGPKLAIIMNYQSLDWVKNYFGKVMFMYIRTTNFYICFSQFMTHLKMMTHN